MLPKAYLTSKRNTISYRSHVALFELSCFGGIDKSPPHRSNSQTVAAILSASEMLRDEHIQCEVNEDVVAYSEYSGRDIFYNRSSSVCHL